MAQPNRQPRRKLRPHGVPSDIDTLLSALRALDRVVVETSARIYKIHRRDRAVMRAQNRRLHDAIRERRSLFR